ncbi:MAG TPA: PKD domain-containing protein [Chthoniobacterales bacterium]|nr:PKD domain-containing protein [Chthoniobacterales bacterium]
MKRNPNPYSGFITPRNLFGTLLCITGLSIATFTLSAKPSNKSSSTKRTTNLRPVRPASAPTTPAAGPAPTSGTLSVANPKLTYTDPIGPVPNATGEGVGFTKPTCAANGVDCSNYTVTLDPSVFTASGGYDPTKANIVIQLTWNPSANQYGSFIEDKNGTLLASNLAGLDPETIAIPVVTLNPANGPFTIVTTLEIGSPGTGYTGTVSLITPSGGATAGSGTPPRYQVYVFPGVQSSNGGLEPSIGVDWNPNVASLQHIAPGNASVGPTLLNTGGLVMFTETFDQFQVGFDDCSSPATNTWTNTAFIAQQATTLDAIGFTDHYTSAALGTSYPPPQTPGRTFLGELTAGDSNMSYTDDDGANHTQTTGGGVPQGPDHETVGGGPYNPNSVPPPPPHPTYANAIYYCTQNIAPEAECSRSDDGGLSFGPGVPIYQNVQGCIGSIHGHAKVARDGTVYVPNYSCALPSGTQGVAMSTDNGITWTQNNVPGSGSPKPGLVDPSVGIGLNDVGKPAGNLNGTNTIYFGYIDIDGSPKIASSGDRGAHWSATQNVGAAFNIANSTFPIVVAGDDNRAAFGFLGTTTPGDSSTDANFSGVWHFYVATTYDGGNSWTTVDTTPNSAVQVGAICNAGTTGCTNAGTNRNLLDFNGFDVDSQGRGVASITTGCLNCSNSSPISNSISSQATVVRQSGGRRLFSHFDPVEPSAPANPQAVSAVKQNAPAGVLVSWMEPDNGGSPITAYNIYRGTGSGTEAFLATVSNSPTNTHTKYLDTTALPTVPNYFYHVTAVNAQGESGFCEELSIAPLGCPLGLGSACAAPFVTVDCAGGAGTVPTDPTSGELTIQNVSIGEPFTSCTDNSMTFVMTTQTLDPLATGMAVLPANSEWQILFGVTDTNGSAETLFIDLNTIPPNTPATPGIDIGRRDPSATGGTFDTSGGCTANGSPCSVTATTTPGGVITFKVDLHAPLAFAAPTAGGNGSAFTWNATAPGTQLGAITGNTYLFVGVGAGLLETIQTTGAKGSYTRVGNISCSDKPPIAALSANPSTGNAPLTVSFNAGASNEPAGSCGTINSYTMDFGDGSSPVTQDGSHPTFSHTYTKPGSYPARLTVGDTANQTSINPAQVVITVNSAVVPQLNTVVSRKAHGTAGTFDINMPLTGTRGIECRSGGTNGDYTIVFTFAHNLTSVDSATVTGGTGTVSSTAAGPNANQFTVNITGVTDAQYITVGLVNAKDSTGAIGNVIGPQMGILVGDTTANGAVNSSDVAQTQAQSGQAVTSNNFREDVTVNGAINSSDIGLVQSKSGTGLP